MNCENLINLYAGKYKSKDAGYCNVKDFIDSVRTFPDLCGVNGDLKNVQRTWIIKTILGSVPIGSNILEIGAGEPLVANILSELGYRVTIVDPYDGTGNGPVDYDGYKKKYPQLNIIRSYFGKELSQLPLKSFDAIYSISVLEHVPADKTIALAEATALFLKNGGRNIHAIDHVFMGAGQEFHEEQLEKYFRGFKVKVDYKVILNQLKNDLETYFMSAEGHLFWLGNTNYDEFPFRKVVSINLNVPSQGR